MADATDEGLRNAARSLLRLARDEDLGPGDVTTALLADPGLDARFDVVVKQTCVFAGFEIAPLVLEAFGPGLSLSWNSSVSDGMRIAQPPASVAEIRGPLGSILAVERTLLNFLQRLCGIATATDAFVQAIAGTGATIYDTRKTLPGWRHLDKYAVRCGGGRNHRMGLYDAVLIKDNHLAGVQADRLAGVVFEMLNRIDPRKPRPAWVEVEAASLTQMKELCKVVGIDVILLDNFTVAGLEEAVAYRDSIGLKGRIELEASGGVTLTSVRRVAETGIERISAGALTHSAPAIDISLERI